jgi:hypothetical protein
MAISLEADLWPASLKACARATSESSVTRQIGKVRLCHGKSDRFTKVGWKIDNLTTSFPAAVLQNFLSEISGPPKDIRTGAPLVFGSVRETWPCARSERG